ncbi:MAG: hypothetical protein K6T51_02475 [Rubrobacteraceae bacterium]|nr:hypothetical protein [Rubrobacteraceae bacterium]MCL6437449.1 hypothetical protein [Rubrobacteraceae bacterium]
MDDIREQLIDRLDAIVITAEWGSLALETGDIDLSDTEEVRNLLTELSDRYREAAVLLETQVEG